MSKIDSEFAPLVPGINDAFRKIWTFSDIDDFRSHWTITRAQLADYIPVDGYVVSHQRVPLSDGNDVEIRIYRPTDTDQEILPLLFVQHGGGWVVGGHDSERSMNQAVCVKNHVAVISVDYRRAPEHKYPTALDDSYEVFGWVIAHANTLCIDSSRIFLAGSSAGANLTASLAIKLRDNNTASGILGQVLNIPAVCHPDHLPHDRFELNSYEHNAEAPTINGRMMRWFWEQYCPSRGNEPLASPLLAEDHSNLPPALIQVAGMDSLRDEGIAYAQVLRNAGVTVKLNIYPGLPHGFILATHMATVNNYFESIVQWVQGCLQRSMASAKKRETKNQAVGRVIIPLAER